MLRKIIKIDEEKCNGCGLCVDACHEGAIGLVDGKARLMREDYCDGLGDCLPACPTGAISFEMREAPAYDEQAVKAAQANTAHQGGHAGCPGSRLKTFSRPMINQQEEKRNESELMQWPVQIQLVPVNAPYFKDANLLIAADCTAYAYGNFHRDFLKDHIVLIGCPKLDQVAYADKLEQIITRNEIKSVSIVRMEVPCCGGLENAAKEALKQSGKFIPWQVYTITTDGQIKR